MCHTRGAIYVYILTQPEPATFRAFCVTKHQNNKLWWRTIDAVHREARVPTTPLHHTTRNKLFNVHLSVHTHREASPPLHHTTPSDHTTPSHHASPPLHPHHACAYLTRIHPNSGQCHLLPSLPSCQADASPDHPTERSHTPASAPTQTHHTPPGYMDMHMYMYMSTMYDAVCVPILPNRLVASLSPESARAALRASHRCNHPWIQIEQGAGIACLLRVTGGSVQVHVRRAMEGCIALGSPIDLPADGAQLPPIIIYVAGAQTKGNWIQQHCIYRPTPLEPSPPCKTLSLSQIISWAAESQIISWAAESQIISWAAEAPDSLSITHFLFMRV